MIDYIKHILTARNGEAFSLTKIISIVTVITMLVNFIRVQSVDFTGLGIAVTGIIAALAAKYHVEDKEQK
jgi:hypothetical protein